MLKPQPQGDFLLQDLPPVFGKPWFWQRSCSTMESTRSLTQVVMEMRDEIKKLEAENRELRRESRPRPLGESPGEVKTGMEEAALENPYGNLRRNASAPALEGPIKEKTAMTVRRYSTTSNLSGLAMREESMEKGLKRSSDWGRLSEEIHDRKEMEKVTSRHSLQEYIHKNRAKVKTVTFLLPVDDIYTSRPALSKHQEETEITGLAAIAETES